MQATLDAMRRQDAKDDAERVNRLIDEYRAGGLAVAGLKDTLEALDNGQVDELLISAPLDAVTTQPPSISADLSDELVTKAARTSATVTFIEDRALLAPVGGVGALWCRPCSGIAGDRGGEDSRRRSAGLGCCKNAVRHGALRVSRIHIGARL